MFPLNRTSGKVGRKWGAALWESSPSPPRQLGIVNFGVGKAFRYTFFDRRFFFRAEETPVYPTLYSIQKLQPILQRWFLDGLPLVVPAFAREEPPLAAHVLRINLERDSLLRHSFPTNFSLRHFVAPTFRLQEISTLATAIAAIPSSRPIKPRCSFVVALIPTFLIVTPKAVAMFNFIAPIWG